MNLNDYQQRYWHIPHPASEENTKMHNYLMQFFNYKVFQQVMLDIRIALEKGPGLN
jgi:hypothetical protein